MKKLCLIIVALSILVLQSCEKEPEPSAFFLLSTYNADVGESISATNESFDAFSYLWNDGDGYESTNENPVFSYDRPGNYSISLTAYSESGEKFDVYSTAVNVEYKNGSVTFWLSGTPQYYQTFVTIGTQTETITHYYPNGPSDCQQAGCANFTLPVGDYNFTATDQEHNWSGSFTIQGGKCLRFQLQ